MMTSIFQQALGAQFSKLHPQLQERFGFTSHDGVAKIGRGTMRRIWHGRRLFLPFLSLGATRHVLFPDEGSDIPFTIENYAYRDELGRETMTFVRTFQFPIPRRFDAYMIYSQQRNGIVDYLGTHQHLAVELDCWVTNNGALRIRSGSHRVYEGFLGFTYPAFLTGEANVHEWYDDQRQQFEIDVTVTNPFWGPIFGYQGTFKEEKRPVPSGKIPEHLIPARYEVRE